MVLSPINKGEGLKTIVCRACQKEKDVKQFYKNNQKYNGYELRCKICHKTRQPIIKNRPSKSKDKILSPYLSRIDEDDFIDAYNFLKKLGYDLEKNIHIQFCEKYALTPRQRKKDKTLYFSPKDLNIV